LRLLTQECIELDRQHEESIQAEAAAEAQSMRDAEE